MEKPIKFGGNWTQIKGTYSILQVSLPAVTLKNMTTAWLAPEEYKL
jgi:hypothetical protein